MQENAAWSNPVSAPYVLNGALARRKDHEDVLVPPTPHLFLSSFQPARVSKPQRMNNLQILPIN